MEVQTKHKDVQIRINNRPSTILIQHLRDMIEQETADSNVVVTEFGGRFQSTLLEFTTGFFGCGHVVDMVAKEYPKHMFVMKFRDSFTSTKELSPVRTWRWIGGELLTI